MATNKDYYVILGISRTESESGIRAAFRELAKRYHPDRVGPQGTPLFQDIVEAYQVLSDPVRRKHYNQGLRQAEGQPEPPTEPITTGRSPQAEPLVPEPWSLLRGVLRMQPSCEALQERLRRHFTGRRVPPGEREARLNLEVILSPDEALRGGMVPIGVPVFYPCPACGGSGRDWRFPCSLCRAHGLIEEEKVVRVPLPPLVRDGTIVEVPVRRVGMQNFSLRLHIRIMT